ncbi:ABC transporter permease [Miniphocaeibacter massiliensis]|uniref:ABC transporter permease n=1 Tax=Miniphocaeibacter massiliensis TaxID=2041841 RepID=UPI000C1BDAAF|nr:ABC transporter permease [Miniphocaeibacter massiliensis]
MDNKIYPSELFEPAIKDSNKDRIKRPTISYWKDVIRRFRKNKLAMLGVIILTVILLIAVIGPIISKFDMEKTVLTGRNIRPGQKGHLFGTDTLGRDLFTRVCFGIKYSLLIGILAAGFDFIIGVVYGGVAGMVGGKVDTVLMRIAEILYSIPYLLIVILISVTFGGNEGVGLGIIIIAMCLTGWIPMAILVRGQVLQLKENEYTLASTSMGAGSSYILKKHVIPNALGPIIVNVTLTIPRAIFSEATLSFMGLGVQQPSLGVLVSEGLGLMGINVFYQIGIPAIFISLVMFSFNVIGDGLRDALDPRLRK